MTPLALSRGRFPADYQRPPHQVWLPLERAWFRLSLGIGQGLHYREMQPFNSRHAQVWPDGTYTIDHYDAYNPDYGHLGEHFASDVVRGGGRG